MLAARSKLLPLENCNHQLLAAPNASPWWSDACKGEYGTKPIAGKKPSRLLVVDADVHFRETVSDVLPANFCECVFEESPDQVEKVLFDNAPFDAILMDLFNPVERFFELISVIKERCPRTEIIFISKLADDDLWIESIQRGAYDLLPKPLDKRELRRILVNALGRNRSADELEFPMALRAGSR